MTGTVKHFVLQKRVVSLQEQEYTWEERQVAAAVLAYYREDTSGDYIKSDYIENHVRRISAEEVSENLNSLADKLEMENWGGENYDVYRVDGMVDKLERISPEESAEEAEAEFGIDRCLEHDHDFL